MRLNQARASTVARVRQVLATRMRPQVAAFAVIGLGVVTLAAAAPAGRSVSHAPAPTVRHNTHITSTRLVLDGPVVLARVRIFRDDFEKALKRKITDDATSKAAIAAYMVPRFVVRADGVALTGEVIDGGGDLDGDQPVWWVLMQWKASTPARSLGLKVQLLFDSFDDQQNLVIVNREPSGERRSLYFHAGDRSEQLLKF